MKKFKFSELNKLILETLKNQIFILQTDTIYGISCVWDKNNLIDDIFKIKHRPPNKKMIILMKSLKQVENYFVISDKQRMQLTKIWPGPTTCILKSNYDEQLYAIRVPNNENIFRLINNIGPLISTSCNISNEKNINNIKEIEQKFGNCISILIYNNKQTNHSPSTIIKFNDEDEIIIIRRPDDRRIHDK